MQPSRKLDPYGVRFRDDAMGRFGGEEFVPVFPGPDGDIAMQWLNEIRA